VKQWVYVEQIVPVLEQKMTDLNDLQFFFHVSQAQSFTEAARRLDVPKSTVSRAITRLEQRLGIRLLERTTRRVGLTEAGELYLNHCERVLGEAEQAEVAIGTMLAKPRGLLRIAAPVPFARGILGPSLGAFLNCYPELRVHLEILNAATSLRQGNFDVIIHPGPMADSGWLVKRVMQIRLGAFASSDYLRKRGTPTAPADLKQHSCITNNCGIFGEHAQSAAWRLRNGSDVRELKLESRISVPDPTISHQLACAGVGIALLAHVLVERDVEEGRLVRVLPDWQPNPVELHALYSSRLDSSPKVRAFLQFLRDSCRLAAGTA
jgi:DNA-binding transcriptional LysR family regulator